MTSRLAAGHVLTGPLFSEPMRVETVQQANPASHVVGLVGMQSERYRPVREDDPSYQGENHES